jgi:hypothetical protein
VVSATDPHGCNLGFLDPVKIYLREIKWSCMDWIDLALDRDQWMVLVNTVMNLRVPQHFGKFLSSCITGSFSRSQVYEISYVKIL